MADEPSVTQQAHGSYIAQASHGGTATVQVDTQYNADQIHIYQPPLSPTEKQRKQNRTRMLEWVQEESYRS